MIVDYTSRTGQHGMTTKRHYHWTGQTQLHGLESRNHPYHILPSPHPYLVLIEDPAAVLRVKLLKTVGLLSYLTNVQPLQPGGLRELLTGGRFAHTRGAWGKGWSQKFGGGYGRLSACVALVIM